MFSLVSARYERASLIVTSNKPFSALGEIFGDEVVVAAMIDEGGTPADAGVFAGLRATAGKLAVDAGGPRAARPWALRGVARRRTARLG